MKNDIQKKLEKLTPEQRAVLEKKLMEKSAKKQKTPAIPKRENSEEYPMSFAQERLWFLHQLNPKSAFYNIPVAIKIKGNLNLDNFEKSIKTVIDRHEILHAVFRVNNNTPVQMLKKSDFKLNVKKVDPRQENVLKLINEEAQQPFDLKNGPLYRIQLLELDNNEFILLFTLHHIVADGWSVQILINEIINYYQAFNSNKSAVVEPLSIQYFDYAAYQKNSLTKEAEQEHIQFWKQELDGMPQVINLPYDKPRPSSQTFNGDREFFEIPSELTQAIKELGRKFGVTPFVIFLSAFEVFLYKYTLQEDFGVGTLFADRQKRETKNLVGFFVNTLVKRAKIDPNISFQLYVKNVREKLIRSFEHGILPFEKVVENILEKRDLSYSPLFQVMFDYQESPFNKINLDDIELEIIPQDLPIAKFDLLCILEENKENIRGYFEYNTDLFFKHTVKKMTADFVSLLKNIVLNPDSQLKNLDVLSGKTKQILIKEWNRTEYPVDFEDNVINIFEKQVEKSKDETAVIYKNTKLSYLEFNNKVNKLSNYLINKGIKRESRIGVFIERSPELVISLYAALKAGGAYVPIDTEYPQERIDYIVDDSQVKVILTVSKFRERINHPNVIYIDEIQHELERISDENPSVNIFPENAAYMIYTSGSTGKPKGVVISHMSLFNRLVWMQKTFAISADDKILQKTPFSFDVSVWEFFWPLMVGAQLVVAEPNVHRDPSYLIDCIVKNKITTIHFVPSMLDVFLDNAKAADCKSLKRVICSGEALTREHKIKFDGKLGFAGLYNLYGPTEAAIDVSYFKVDGEIHTNTVPIGKPVFNTQLYVLDKYLNPVPVGVAGELYIGGIQLARGYNNRPGLTAEKFIPDPFGNKLGGRLYKTGDLVKYHADGNIEFLSRIDNQIKLRGLRIELGEIESAIRSLKEIKECIVLTHGKEVNQQLIAFVVSNDGYEINRDNIKQKLRESLPVYMVPSKIVEVENIPLTHNGKIDRKALLNLVKNELGIRNEKGKAPRNKLERYLVNIWEETLGIDNIKINDNFFELGGNSLQAATIVNKLQNDLNEEFHVGILFFMQTVAEISYHLVEYYPDKIQSFFGEDFREFYNKNFGLQVDEESKVTKAKIEEFENYIPKLTPRDVPPSKNKQAVFVLSPPRSGSTLLRVMLNSNKKLFAPPELELMSFSTLGERKKAFSGEFEFLRHGVIRAIMELKNCSNEEAEQMMYEFEEDDLTVKEFYGILQQFLGDRLLVDKTPIYSLNKEILNRIEDDFNNPLYVHLIRHPYAVIYSFVEAKMKSFVFRKETPFTLRELGELVWYVSHKNILEFFKKIPEDRKFFLKFDDLILDARNTLTKLCDFLGVEFDEQMLDPYSSTNMTNGINALVPMVGDLKFYYHKKIDPYVLDKWKEKHTVDFLSNESISLAREFGYEIKSEAPQKKSSTKFETYLVNLWKEILEIDKIELNDNVFELGANSLQSAVFINRLQQDFQVEIPVQSVYQAPSISEFAYYAKEYFPELVREKFPEDFETEPVEISRFDTDSGEKLNDEQIREFKNIIVPAEEVDFKEDKNPPAAFILSPPRSGSTLLRVMLQGHSKLFAPPELDLLTFTTLRERKEKLSGKYSLWLEATYRAIMELRNCSLEEAAGIMEELEGKNITTKEFYRLLQDWAGGKLLVDKTPTYALDKNILKRAENYFENTKYIHLLRHPYASIYSFIEAKLDENFFRYDNPFSRRELAELIWLHSHNNIISFLDDIPAERKFVIKFEDMLLNPENQIKELCDFLEIEFEDSMLNPYDGNRMTDPVIKNSQMVGDFKFYLHKKIDNSVIDRWKKYHKSDFLHPQTKELAERFNYNVIVDGGKKEVRRIQPFSKIEKVDRNKELKLSHAQQRLWFLEQLEPGLPTYNIPSTIKIKGKLDTNILLKALTYLIERHESLRTVFPSVEGKARQVILPGISIDLNYENLTDLDFEIREKIALEKIEEEALKPFNLSEGPLVRFKLIQTQDDEYYFLSCMHHIITDGWSIQIFVRELTTIYSNFINGEEVSLEPLSIQYVDFSEWQSEWLKSDFYVKQLNYWKTKLEGAPSLLELPTDFPRKPLQTLEGNRIRFTVDDTQFDSIKKLSINSKSTTYVILLTVFNILLGKYARSNDILVGTPVAGRTRKELENIIGLFVNTLVLRTKLNPDDSILELIEQIKKNTFEALSNQELPFEKLVDELNIERSLSHSPLFQVMFVYNQNVFQAIKSDDFVVQPIPLNLKTSKFDITLVLTEFENRITFDLEYNSGLFKEETIKRMIEHFKYILELMTKNPSIKFSQVELVKDDEKELLLNKWNNTKIDFPDYVTIPELIKENALRNPEQTAVELNGETVNYGDLEKLSNGVANYLMKAGVRPDDIVGIYMYPSVETIIVILGIIKCGAAYLPLDPSYPEKRIEYMLNDSGVKLIFARNELAGKLSGKDFDFISPEIFNENSLFKNYSAPNIKIYPENSAYVIYTSGSTGKPKGVVQTHKGIINHAFDIDRRKPIRNGVCSLWTSLNFDVSIYEIFYPLIFGNELHIVPQEIRAIGDKLFEWLYIHKVNSSYLPPFVLEEFNGWLEENPGKSFLKKLLVGVEPIKLKTLSGIYDKIPDLLILNGYGPTETTVCSTIYPVNKKIFSDDITPIGKAMSNTRIFILDEFMNLSPIGVPGEVYIESVGEARGYLNRPDLTAERFVPNPFSTKGGERLYRTGDLAFYQPDGNIKFVGRIDNQVKFKGFRIELGEIEENIKNHPAVNEAAVIIREDQPGIKKLVGYFTLTEGEKTDGTELRNYLNELLPDYMIPSLFVNLDEMPKTPNGKIDRKNLPVPTEDDLVLSSEFVEAKSDTEKILLEIWKDVLKVNKIGALDNFFELGGDSILGIQVIAKANAAGLKLSPKNLFEAPTIMGLANLANKAKKIVAEQGLIEGEVPLTPIQKWFFEKQFANPNHWNQSVLLEVSEQVDTDKFAEAVREIMKHHDVLRLRFLKEGENYRQIFSEMNSKIPFEVVELSGDNIEEKIIGKSADFQNTLDIEKGPLFKIVYFKLNGLPTDRLLIIVHHLVIDGVSWRILLEDLQTAYEQLVRGMPVKLPPKTTSFKYWSEKLKQSADDELWIKELDYWENIGKFNQYGKVQIDFNKGENSEKSQKFIAVKIPKEKTEILLNETVKKFNTNVNEILLATFNYALAQWDGKRKHIIGMEGHGREDIFEDVDISRTVGWFTSLFPVLIDLKDSVNVIDALKYVKEQFRKIPQNGIGYGVLKYLSGNPNAKEIMNNISEPEIVFNYLGIFNSEDEANGKFKKARESAGNERNPENLRAHVLDVTGNIVDGELVLHINFSGNLYNVSTINELANLFENNIIGLITSSKISEEKIVSASDFEDAELSDDDLDDLLMELDN